jgi:hypothetical protein
VSCLVKILVSEHQFGIKRLVSIYEYQKQILIVDEITQPLQEHEQLTYWMENKAMKLFEGNPMKLPLALFSISYFKLVFIIK